MYAGYGRERRMLGWQDYVSHDDISQNWVLVEHR